MANKLTYEDIARHVFSDSSFKRGGTYYRAGAVSDIKVVSDRTIAGRVRGTASRPYETRLTVKGNKIKSSSCSCPMGSHCKHVAALGLAALYSLAGSVSNTLEIKTDKRPAWEQTLSSLMKKTKQTDDTGDLWELSVAVRVEPARHQYGEDGKWSVQLRPRVFDPATGRSGFKLPWPAMSMFGHSLKNENLSAEQASFLEQLTFALNVGYGAATGWITVDPERAYAVWHVLKRAPEHNVKIVSETGKNDIEVGQAALTRELVLEDYSKNQVRMREGLFLEGQELDWKDVLTIGNPPSIVLLVHPSSWGKPTFDAVYGVRDKNDGMPFIDSPIIIPHKDVKTFQNRYARSLAEKYAVQTKTEQVKVPEIGVPKGLVTIDKARKKEAAISVKPALRYGDKIMPLYHDREEIAGAGGTSVVPDKKKENDIKDILQALLWAQRKDDGKLPDKFIVSGMEAAAFMSHTAERLRQQEDIEVSVSEAVPQFTRDTSDPDVTFNVGENSDDPDWFDLNITVKISGEEVPFAALFESLVQAESNFMLPSGRYFSLNHKAFDKLRDLIIEAGKTKEVTKDGISISRYQVDYWSDLEKLGIVDKQTKKWQAQMKKMLKAKVTRFQPPPGLKADLRDYQLKGYSWLRFLYKNNMGGILADDMGLGKTVQMIALILSRPQKSGPVLIIAPTSVTDTWESEIAKFAPQLKTVVLRSGNREHLYKGVSKADAIIISYALIWRDYERLKKYEFDMCVLDEAQMVKNYQSKLYSLVRKIRAKRKFALTGTPMENSVMELWAISSISAPGLFARPDHFREYFQRPIEKHRDSKALKKLRSRIKPFFMRRSKEQVEAQLPPKTVQTLVLDLHEKHRHTYDVHLQRERKRILGLLAEGGLQAHRFEILKSITRMRQLALHPGLINKRQKNMPNAKLDELVRQVQELATEGHKALIFSQFTSFLAYVKDKLEEVHVPYLYLDGSTRNRGRLVKQFQSPACRECAFVISLKAGGVGLTLTAADYCFILDPWWNPAVENQAIDRTHRIGQNKHVHVYKMIGKSTIEEKVLALQDKKAKLFRDVIEGDGTFAQGITDDDIRMLIE